MSAADVPKGVKRFIAAHITSVEQLEILLLLRGDPAVEWDPRDVSNELYSQPESALRRLDDLTARGLLVCAGNRFRYAPANAGLAKAVEELADTYARRRVRVITQIFAGPDEAAESFSAAFRFKDED